MKKIIRFALVIILISIAMLVLSIAIYFLIINYSKAQNGWIILVWNNVLYWFIISFLMAYLTYKLLPSEKLQATFQNENLGFIGKARIDMSGAIVIFCVFLIILYFSVVKTVFQGIIEQAHPREDPLKMEELSVQLKVFEDDREVDSPTIRRLIRNHSRIEFLPKPFEIGSQKILKIQVPVRENVTNPLVPTSDRFESGSFNEFQIDIGDANNDVYYTSGRTYELTKFHVASTSEQRFEEAGNSCDLRTGTILVNRDRRKAWLDCFIPLKKVQK